jgi:competence protein ComFC
MMSFVMLKRLGQFIKDVIFPYSCVVCFREGTFLCERCFLAASSKTSIHKEIVHDMALDTIFYCCEYKKNRPIQNIIHNFKYEYVTELAKPLALIMAACAYSFNNPCFLMPVPLHKKRQKWRGFNQSQLLANELSSLSGIPVYDFLERKRFKKPQMELNREERIINMKDAFCIKDNFKDFLQHKNSTIILVDDVATTLSTMNSCAKVLKEAGFKIVCGLTIARSN